MAGAQPPANYVDLVTALGKYYGTVTFLILDSWLPGLVHYVEQVQTPHSDWHLRGHTPIASKLIALGLSKVQLEAANWQYNSFIIIWIPAF